MANKQINPAELLANIMKDSKAFTKMVEDGEAFGVTEDQKVEYKKQIKAQGVDKLMKDFNNKMKELKNISSKVNGTH